jgi:hypothetical protein
VSSQANLQTYLWGSSQQCAPDKIYIYIWHPNFLETVDISLHPGWCSEEIRCWLRHFNDGASHYSFVRWCSTWYQFKHCSSGWASVHTKWAWVDSRYCSSHHWDLSLSLHLAWRISDHSTVMPCGMNFYWQLCSHISVKIQTAFLLAFDHTPLKATKSCFSGLQN